MISINPQFFLMSLNPFSERYKKLNNSDLLDIISNPKDYQDLALEAAKLEFENRQLTDEQKEVAKSELFLKLNAKEEKRKRLMSIEEKLKYTGESVFEKFIPVMSNPRPTLNKTDRITTLLLIIYLIYFISEIKLLRINLSYYNEDLKMDLLTSLPQLIMFPIIIFLFWKRRKSGWILMTIFFSFCASGLLFYFVSELFNLVVENETDNIFSFSIAFEFILPFCILIFIFCFSSWYLCKKDLREIYKIDRLEHFSALIFGIAIALLIITSI
mgnify:CR=1 FL=1